MLVLKASFRKGQPVKFNDRLVWDYFKDCTYYYLFIKQKQFNTVKFWSTNSNRLELSQNAYLDLDEFKMFAEFLYTSNTKVH